MIAIFHYFLAKPKILEIFTIFKRIINLYSVISNRPICFEFPHFFAVVHFGNSYAPQSLILRCANSGFSLKWKTG